MHLVKKRRNQTKSGIQKNKNCSHYNNLKDFPGSTEDRSLPANALDMGLILIPERFQMLEQLGLCAPSTEPLI